MMKNILLIATGGTIASRSTSNGLTPQLGPGEILEYVPSVQRLCHVDCIQLFNLDSTNILPKHWEAMVKAIEERYDRYDGFVILHGTDTMAYTSAALSYMIQSSPKPVVLTGAQRPIDKEITDAKMNLRDSILYACDDDSHDVVIVFQGHVIAGTRARKIRSKSFNAFSSINFPDVAVISGERIIRYIEWKAGNGPRFYTRLNPRVFTLKLVPGMDAGVIHYLMPYYDALIIESFGVGGIPCYEGDVYMKALEEWTGSKKLLVMTTQVPNEGSDMVIYNVGSRVKRRFDLLEAYDMTPEATVTKLMWLLGTYSDDNEIKKGFYTRINHDLMTV
ncbi:L-asparaginase [Catenibacillus scindens]|uniref:asparaginase n=2 Tax=Catenibacillus scindens TaxID=673271 RepID=A0A7W8M5H1_9FIRM|nr:L-asparaginase [Catenibacillus scindens]